MTSNDVTNRDIISQIFKSGEAKSVQAVTPISDLMTIQLEKGRESSETYIGVKNP